MANLSHGTLIVAMLRDNGALHGPSRVVAGAWGCPGANPSARLTAPASPVTSQPRRVLTDEKIESIFYITLGENG